MKKLILIFLLFISVFSFSRENFTENEKTVILKQFVEFQKAVKNRDMKSIEKFLDDYVYGFGYMDQTSYSYDTPVDYNKIVGYKSEFFEVMEETTLLKVYPKNNEVKKYIKGNLTITGEFYAWENNESLFPAWLNELYKPDEKIFEILLVDDDPEYPGFSRYIFKIKNNELKFSSFTGGP